MDAWTFSIRDTELLPAIHKGPADPLRTLVSGLHFVPPRVAPKTNVSLRNHFAKHWATAFSKEVILALHILQALSDRLPNRQVALLQWHAVWRTCLLQFIQLRPQ